jgi:CYTH domain-containing protein
VEREQRWLLDAVPRATSDPREITDHYVVGTSLRLRKITSESEVIYKLAQKIRPDAESPAVVKITNIYLSSDEYDRLLVLGGSSISKRRHRLAHEGTTYAIDEFHGRHTGLLLAEVEIGEADPRLALPSFALSEVTSDNRFSGGWLASATEGQLRDLLAVKQDTSD